jgi:hypothetical protein
VAATEERIQQRQIEDEKEKRIMRAAAIDVLRAVGLLRDLLPTETPPSYGIVPFLTSLAGTLQFMCRNGTCPKIHAESGYSRAKPLFESEGMKPTLTLWWAQPPTLSVTVWT